MPSRSGAARQAIARQRSHIDGLFTRVTEQPDPADTLEFQSEWAGYLCVRISGAIEISVQSIFLEYATSGADERVQRFMQRRLRDRNMNTETILRICGLFDPEWRRNIDDTLRSKPELKEAVDGIIDKRNYFAHGETSPVSLATVKGWFPLVFDVIELVAAECGV